MLINVRCSWKRKALPCMVDAPLTFLCLPNTCSGPQGRSGHPGRPGNAVTNTRMHTSAHVRMSQRGRKRAHHTQFSGRLAHTHSHTYVCVCVCVLFHCFSMIFYCAFNPSRPPFRSPVLPFALPSSLPPLSLPLPPSLRPPRIPPLRPAHSPCSLLPPCSRSLFAGLPGDEGNRGRQGPIGSTGNVGRQGVDGDRGPQGIRGAPGVRVCVCVFCVRTCARARVMYGDSNMGSSNIGKVYTVMVVKCMR